MSFREKAKDAKRNAMYHAKHLEFKLKNNGAHFPGMVPYNSVLQNKEDYINANLEIKKLHLPSHPDIKKNWDSLAALDVILRNTDKSSHIIDAGGEKYSALLPSLYFYGYKNLIGNNIAFKNEDSFRSIKYEYGDITKTRFPSNSIDAVSCLSVIEHGVNLNDYFKEMSRIIKPGGILFTSTDYWENPIDTQGKEAYGSPIKIFSGKDITDAINTAKEHNLELTEDINLKCNEKIVHWKDLDFTFIYFTLKKKKD